MVQKTFIGFLGYLGTVKTKGCGNHLFAYCFEVLGNYAKQLGFKRGSVERVQKLLVFIGVLRYLGTMKINYVKTIGFHKGFEVP